MKTLAACFALLAALLLGTSGAAQAQPAPACQLMIDASGSMAGYYDAERLNHAPENAAARLRPLLERLRSLCGRTLLFDISPRELPPGAPIGAGPSNTDIGRSLSEWSRTAPDGSFLILVTDNVEDPGTGGANSNERFYNLLRSRDSLFSHVSVLAVRAPFHGLLYSSTPGVRGIPYQGPRALTMYLLGKNAHGRDDAYRATRAALERLLAQSGRREFQGHGGGDGDYSSFVLFDVRPFATETFRVRGQNMAVTTSNRGGSRCARTRFDPATGTFYLYDQQMGVRCDVSAVLTVRIPQRWCLNDTSLRAVASLNASDPSLREGLGAAVSPPRANLCSQEQELHASLQFNPIEYGSDVGFMERLRRSFSGTFEADGEFRILGSMSRGNIELGGNVSQAWSYDAAEGIVSPDPAMQRRVFQLDSAVRSVIPDALLANNELIRYKVEVRGRYTQGPVLAIIVCILIALLLLAVLVWRARKPRSLVVASYGSETPLRLALFGSGRAMAASGELYITLTNLGPFLFARSNGKIVRGRFASPSGGRVEVVRRGAAGRPVARGRGGGDDFDGFGSAGSDGASGGEQPTIFSIRTVSATNGRREDAYDEGF